MSQSTVITLMPTTDHVGSNPINIVGGKHPGASHTLASSNLQTVIWNVGSNTRGMSPSYFMGTVTVQASLVTTPGVFDWFDVETLPITQTPTGQSGYMNISGNYVWLRVSITDWTDGTIRSITLSY
jgi:hypothetical protein